MDPNIELIIKTLLNIKKTIDTMNGIDDRSPGYVCKCCDRFIDNRTYADSEDQEHEDYCPWRNVTQLCRQLERQI